MMNDKLEWTEQPGEAVVADQERTHECRVELRIQHGGPRLLIRTWKDIAHRSRFINAGTSAPQLP